MKKPIDWLEIARVFGTVIKISTIIKNTLVKIGVGIEILSWIAGNGKKEFVEFLTVLGQAFSASKFKERKLLYEATLDIDTSPKLPFEGAVVQKHIAMVKVKIELWTDGLHVNGKEVILHRFQNQCARNILGYEVDTRLRLEDQNVLNACIEDFLLEHPEFCPDDWKQDENGNTIYIYFWGTIYRNPSGTDLCVRGLYWEDGRLFNHFRWLDVDWNEHRQAAVLKLPLDF